MTLGCSDATVAVGAFSTGTNGSKNSFLLTALPCRCGRGLPLSLCVVLLLAASEFRYMPLAPYRIRVIQRNHSVTTRADSNVKASDSSAVRNDKGSCTLRACELCVMLILREELIGFVNHEEI